MKDDGERAERLERALRIGRSGVVGGGRVEFLMNRPAEGVHVPVEALYLDAARGIRGDRWATTAWLKLPDGRPDPRVQVSIARTDVMRCFTGPEAESVYRCGDNLYVDFDLSERNLPAGSRIRIGAAVLEVSDVVNDACGKFAQRFGAEAFKLVRDPQWADLRLRGLFASIVESGWVRIGDPCRVLSGEEV